MRRTPDDATFGPWRDVKAVLICTGKVFYSLRRARAQRKLNDGSVAIVTLEELGPFPYRELGNVLALLAPGGTVRWVQEEPKNMGAWSYVSARYRALAEKVEDVVPAAARALRRLRNGTAPPLEYVGRMPTAAATGSFYIHMREEQELLSKAFAGLSAIEDDVFTAFPDSFEG